MLLPLTVSLLNLDEDSRKSPIILAEKLWPLRLQTSVFLITGAENFPRASVLVSEICLSKDWAMWLPAAPSQAQSSFQRAGHMVPQVSHCILEHRLRTGTSQKGTCSHTKPGCITSNHKISQTGPFLLRVDRVKNLGRQLGHKPGQSRLICIVSKTWSQLYTWWSTGTGPSQKNKARENFTKKALFQLVSPQLCQCLLSSQWRSYLVLNDAAGF